MRSLLLSLCLLSASANALDVSSASFTRGFLPYGSNDSCVIFKNPLTSQLSSGDVSAIYSTLTIRGGSAPTHNSSGMRATDGAAVTYYSLTNPTSLITNMMQTGWQIRFEINSAWIATNGGTLGTNGSVGYVPSGNEYAIASFTASSNGLVAKAVGTNGQFVLGANLTNNQTIHNSTTGQILTPIFGGTTAYIHSYGLGEYATIELMGLPSGQIFAFIDGMPVTGSNYNTAVNILTQMGLMGQSNATGASVASSYYMKNVQICNKPPVWMTPKEIANIAVLSDSQWIGPSSNSSYGPSIASMYTLKTLMSAGVKPSVFLVDQNSGYRIQSTNQLETRVSTILAANPSLVIINGGVNDANLGGSHNSSLFLAEYKDLLEQLFLGTGKTLRTTVRNVIVSIPTPLDGAVSDSAISAAHADVREQIAKLPAWWNSTYGATYGNDRVVIADNWTATGASHNWCNGTCSASSVLSYDGTHWSYGGSKAVGENVGRVIMNSIIGHY